MSTDRARLVDYSFLTLPHPPLETGETVAARICVQKNFIPDCYLMAGSAMFATHLAAVAPALTFENKAFLRERCRSGGAGGVFRVVVACCCSDTHTHAVLVVPILHNRTDAVCQMLAHLASLYAEATHAPWQLSQKR